MNQPVRIMSILQVFLSDSIIVNSAKVLKPGSIDTVLSMDSLHLLVHYHLRTT